VGSRDRRIDGNRRSAAFRRGSTASDLEATIQNEAPTQSYSKIYGSRRVSSSVEAVVGRNSTAVRKETSGLKGERVVGVVVAYGGEVGVERHLRFRRTLQPLLEQAAAQLCGEAVARPTTAGKGFRKRCAGNSCGD